MLAAIPAPEATVHFFERHSLPCRVVRVETGLEFEAQRHLLSRGVKTFCPTYKFTQRFSDRKPVVVLKALFGGYIFGAFAAPDRDLVVSAPKVMDILRTDGREDAVIDELEMQRLRAMSDLAGTEPWERLVEGQNIRVCSGPLAGTYGKLLKRAGETSLIVEVSMLNRFVRTKIDGWSIEKA